MNFEKFIHPRDLRNQVEELKKALEFYANKKNWKGEWISLGQWRYFQKAPARLDKGQLARDILNNATDALNH